jgi:8-oxo-dGTP pyrophosphatase MutT (NUDIX family)
MASNRDSSSSQADRPSDKRAAALSAGVVPVLRDQKLYLLLRAYRYWDFPKGIVEKGEDPLAAAVRELQEESGLSHPKFRWGEDFMETERYSYGKIARYYVAEVSEEKIELIANPVSGRREHDEYRWVTYDEAVKLLVPRVKRVLDWAEGLVSGRTTSREPAGLHFPL